MVMQSTDVQIADFSGGITGDPRKANGNQSMVMNNMVITDKKSAKVRYGSRPIHQSISFTRTRGIYENNSSIYLMKASDIYKLNANTTATLVPTVDTVGMFTIGVEDVSVCGRKWRNHLLFTGTDGRRPTQLYRDGGSVDRITTVGLPSFTATQKTAFSASGTAGANSYIIAVIWTYEYVVGGVTYRKVSRTHRKTISNLSGANISFSNIPVLDPTDYIGDNHYDIANIKAEVYISIANGTALFRVATVNNGTLTSGPHTINDTTHISNVGLYTNGGLLDHDNPPVCKDIQLVNDTAYYLNTVEEFDDGTSEPKPFRIIQSIPGVATSINNDFFLDLDDDIVGGGVANGNLIVFTDTFIYRIEGQISASGAGSMRAITINKDIGCMSRDSIVSTKDGVFFAGRDGFYFTNGTSFKELTAGDKSLERIYRKLVMTDVIANRINAILDATNNRIVWSTSSSSEASENDQWWVYDITFDAFTTANGSSFYSSCLLYDREKIYRGDDFGYVYEHSEDIDCDFKRDTTKAITLWYKSPIPWELKPSYFTNLNERLWARSINLAVESGRDISIGISVDLINGRKYSMVPLVYKGNSVWRDLSNLWRDLSNVWKPSILQTKRRRIPSGAGRTRGVTVSLSAGKSALYISDLLGTATLTYKNPSDPIEILVELDNVNYVWPSDLVGYTIAFEHTDYKVIHSITAQTNTTLTVAGGSTTILPNVKWQIVGIPNLQDVEIKSITYTHGVIGKEENQFQTGQDNVNA
jgi:hypothetical protein